MDDDFYWEIYEMFEEQLNSQLPQIKDLLIDLKSRDTANHTLQELFRFFHTYKATSSYLSLTPMHALVARVEMVLGSLRNSESSVPDSIVEWLEDVTEQMFLYSDQIGLKKTTLSEVPKSLFDTVNLKRNLIKPHETLKSLSLLYISKTEKKAEKVIKFLSKYLGMVKNCNVKHMHQDLENLDLYDIVIVNLGANNHDVIKILKSYDKNIPIITMFDKISTGCAEKLIKNGVSHNIEAPINAEKLEAELLSIVKIYYSGSHLIINHKKITHFISNLKPLSKTIFEIMQMCDDEEIPVKELVKVVKTDPIITAKILRLANSPIYGSSEITTIDQAVAKFGKMLTKTFSLGSTHDSLGEIDISAYGITEDDFSTASMTRVSLAIKWYSKISVAELSILSSVAFLSSIGQLLISKEIISMEEVEHFQELAKEFTFQFAEETILNTNTNNVSSQILRYWKLSSDILTVIEHTDYPLGAPKEFQRMCAANNIISALVDEKGNVLQEIPKALRTIMKDFKFDEKVLLKAMVSFKE